MGRLAATPSRAWRRRRSVSGPSPRQLDEDPLRAADVAEPVDRLRAPAGRQPPRQRQWVDRVVGLEGVQVDGAMLEAPDGLERLELVKFRAPSGPGGDRNAPAHAPGIRHVAFAVDDIDAVVARLPARGAELVGEVERYGDIRRRPRTRPAARVRARRRTPVAAARSSTTMPTRSMCWIVMRSTVATRRPHLQRLSVADRLATLRRLSARDEHLILRSTARSAVLGPPFSPVRPDRNGARVSTPPGW
jgi:hypothetical protein